jgi:hypothetical protein
MPRIFSLGCRALARHRGLGTLTNYLEGQYDLAKSRGGLHVKAPVDRLLCVASALNAVPKQFGTPDIMAHLKAIGAPTSAKAVERTLLRLGAQVRLLEEKEVDGARVRTWVKVGSL